VQGRLLLNVVVGEGTSVLKLLSSKDQTLLVRGDSLLVLDLGLDVVNSVGRLHLLSSIVNYEPLQQLRDRASASYRQLGDELTSRVIVFPVRVLTKICIVIEL
jgi:hypothetical protein